MRDVFESDGSVQCLFFQQLDLANLGLMPNVRNMLGVLPTVSRLESEVAM